MHFMQIESVLQTKNRSEPAKNRFSVALPQNFKYLLSNKIYQVIPCLLDKIFSLWLFSVQGI